MSIERTPSVTRTQCASVAILRQKDKGLEILMQVRQDEKGLDLPGGHLKKSETPEEAAERETLEESGLVVAIHTLLGVFRGRKGDEGENLLVIYFFAAEVVGGALQKSDETTGFRWVSLEKLPKAGVMGRTRPGYPRGLTYAMAERALSQESPVLSKVDDPRNLAIIA